MPVEDVQQPESEREVVDKWMEAASANTVPNGLGEADGRRGTEPNGAKANGHRYGWHRKRDKDKDRDKDKLNVKDRPRLGRFHTQYE